MASTFRFLALSFVIHGILIAFLPAQFPNVETPKSQLFNIRIIEMAKKPPPASAVVSTIAPRKVPAKKPAVGASSNPSAFGGYSDLFPSAAESLAFAERSEAAQTGVASSFDSEGDAYPNATQFKNLAHLGQFASALGSRLSIPDGLKLHSPRGRAFVRLSRKADGWHVMDVSGDSFYRALLYEILDSQPPRGYLYRLLDGIDYPTLRIYFSLAPVWANDETAQPLVTRTSSNKVFLDFTHVHVDVKWQMLMAFNNPIGNASVVPNLVGIGRFFWSKATETDSTNDLDVKKLRLSPAFSRPIGR